ncbi:GNAT family N-acetyltransferase [Yeosuana sp. AK3]
MTKVFSLYFFALITYKLYQSVKDIPKQSWDDLSSRDVFLKTPYLEASSKALPKTISMSYVGVFKDHQLLGVAVVQHVQLYLKDMFRREGASCFKEAIQNVVSKFLKGHILVVGNLTHTGQHGLFFNESLITSSEFLTIIFEAIEEIQKTIKKDFKKTIRLILFKDYFENDPIHKEHMAFKAQKFHKLKVQPNMLMATKKSWLSVEDYLNAITTKYRARYYRARKKRTNIFIRELDLNTLKKTSSTVYNLYLNVSKNAAFNTFVLPENHFWSLKEYLEDNFKVFGYYFEEDLIGFYSLILNNDCLETYFLGYETNHQHTNQLYLNMLYDMAEYAIQNNFKTVVYARTAMEIKSSVGAKPETMYMYLKYTNPLINSVLKQVFRFMNPSQQWEERHPFKN